MCGMRHQRQAAKQRFRPHAVLAGSCPFPVGPRARSDPRSGWRGGGFAIGLCVIAVAVASGACSDDGDEETRNNAGETVTTAPPETTTTVPVEQEVEEAYLAYWAMLDRLAQDPNPDDPEIRERASGQAQDMAVDGLTTMQDAGWRSEFGDEHGHSVLSVTVDGDEAVVQHCAVDQSQVIDTTTGEVVRDGSATIFYEAALRQTNIGWDVHTVAEIDPLLDNANCSQVD